MGRITLIKNNLSDDFPYLFKMNLGREQCSRLLQLRAIGKIINHSEWTRYALRWCCANKHLTLESSPLRNMVRAGFHLVSLVKLRYQRIDRLRVSPLSHQIDSSLKEPTQLTWNGVKIQPRNCKESTLLCYVINSTLSSLVLLMLCSQKKCLLVADRQRLVFQATKDHTANSLCFQVMNWIWLLLKEAVAFCSWMACINFSSE